MTIFLEKIFISQFGAINPPWIHKDVFYKLPFNFCDRWCERCNLSGICRVYQKEKEREKSFEETKKLLEKEIKRLKIIITDEDDKRFEAEEGRKNKLMKNNHLTQISKKLSYCLVKLVEDLHYYLFEETLKELKEPLEILTYYIHFFSVKIQRAILSEIEERQMKYEDSTYDSKNSAFLSYVAIVKIINSLKIISKFKNLHFQIKQKIKKLILLFEDLNGVLAGKFGLTLIKSL